MPDSYSDILKLRLDSNVIFFEELGPQIYRLEDTFSVKQGPKITLEIGTWEADAGFSLEKSLNRWERRVDLRGATLVNGFSVSGVWANFRRNENGSVAKDGAGNIVGSQGYFQDMLFYMTDRLHLTVKTLEMPRRDHFAMLRQGAVDVDSTGLGINLQRTAFIDFPIPTLKIEDILVAAKPRGTAPNMWVYVQVFGVPQWFVFLGLLVMLAIGLSIIESLGAKSQYQLDYLQSSIALAYLYTLQMGSHINTTRKHIMATRSITITISLLTLLSFVYYTSEITAKMTSGPPNIPIRNFEDIIYYDYSMIVTFPAYKTMFAKAEAGSAKQMIYERHLETEGDLMSVDEAFKEVATEEKTLYYTGSTALTSKKAKAYRGEIVGLKMDDSSYSLMTLLLPKDSEFLPLFNFYILKELEHGIIARLYRKYHVDFYVNEQFEMTEAVPLGINNVMFSFIFLGLGIIFSLLITAIELVNKKWKKKTSLDKMMVG